MKIRNEVVNNFMTMNFKFQGIRLINTFLEPAAYTLDVNLTSLADFRSPGDFKEIQLEGTIAFQKLCFWLEAVLPGVVMVDGADETGFGMSTILGNIIMHCPGEPSDELLVRMLHSKISAIVNSKLIVGEIVLGADDNCSTFTFVPNAHGYFLPNSVREYLNLASLYKVPWWARKDGFCFEFVKGNSIKEKLTDIYKDIPDPLVEFEVSLRESLSGVTRAPAPVIEHDKWKPKKI